MTKFEKKVYNLVKSIGLGQTMTYIEVARAIRSPGAARAVGNALNKNHDKNIPCHRVIRSDGRAGGYNLGLKLKEKLLREEGAIN
jgi:O-6-methylguanine DNA methyltransferase